MPCTEVELSALVAAIPAMSTRDASFAASLAGRAASALSEKQAYWVRKLTIAATAAPVAAPDAGVRPDLSAINALFAGLGGARTKVTIGTKELALRLNVAGAGSSAPGSINVCSTDRGFDSRVWFGRIAQDGTFKSSTKIPATDANRVASVLVCFAADPVGQFKAYGIETGECSICSRELTDPKSIAIGIGPICRAKLEKNGFAL